jgi:hypothetical protein
LVFSSTAKNTNSVFVAICATTPLLSSKNGVLRLGLGFWDWFFDDEHKVGVRFEDKKAVMVGPIWVAQDAGPGYKVPKS